MAVSKYTKADIVDLVYERTDASKKDIRIVIDLFIDELKEALKRNMVIELRGFGTFEIKTRKGRLKARNPRTGKSVEVDTHGIAAFRPGRALKGAVWNLASPGDSAGIAGAGAVESGAGPVEGGVANMAPPGGGEIAGEQ
jgi:integration host factor subunit beta